MIFAIILGWAVFFWMARGVEYTRLQSAGWATLGMILCLFGAVVINL